MGKKKVIIFAPFGNWIVHTQLDCVLGAALTNRGCEVKTIACDGLFPTCLVKGSPPDQARCEDCQKTGTEWFSRFKLPVLQMSSMLGEDDRKRAFDWAEDIDLNHLADALFDGWQVGRWMIWATHSALRRGRLDFEDPVVARRARDLAFHGALIAIAVPRIIDDFKPDAALCYSGSNSYYRVFCEIVRKAGIPVIVHERGSIDGSFFIGSGMPTYELMKQEPPGWEAWRDVPLSTQQLNQIVEFFEGRAAGKNTNFQAIHNFRSEAEKVRHRLRIPAGKKILLALASGDWEFGMFCSFGGLHVLWDTQFEWLKETARICKEQGWLLVIRQHPLGAGKKTYPRATAFLSEMLREHPWIDENVRFIMPAENLSTYDVFHIVDAVVQQFSRAGAEAFARGVPAVCVTDCSLAYMGIPVVRTRQDYVEALQAAMAKAPCIDEESLRLAYRFAHFKFFVLGAAVFKSVGVKNVYEPDFRLTSADDLVPGADPRLDEICEHLLHGAPLYPKPAEIPSLQMETDFIHQHREQLLEQRLAIRAGLVDQPDQPVTVLRLSANLPTSNDDVTPARWRCRHRNVSIEWMRLDVGGGMDPVQFSLGGRSADLSSPYLYVLPAGVRLDESAISQAVDALELPENKDKTGALMGCYAMEADETLGSEWNTATHPPQASQLPPPEIEALSQPLTVIGLVVWRREKLAAWLAEMTKEIGDNDDIWCSTMMSSFLDASRFVNLAEPLVVLESVEARSSLLEKLDKVAAENVDAALQGLAEVRQRYGFAAGLRLHMARWLIDAKRQSQALPLIVAEMKAGQGGRAAWDQLVRALPEARGRKQSFDLFWSAVDTVHGYMVTGQEKFLHQKVLSLPADARIIEIGSCHGRSTVAMAFACVGTNRRITCVDTFCGNEGIMTIVSRFKHLFRGNLRRWGLESYASTEVGFSHPVVRAMPETEMFDFAFIDASHEYADVLLDFELVYPRVKPGGWIAFHDVAPGWPGSWRVWEQTGKPLLTDHAICETLACGRKQAGVPWRNYEDQWPGYLAAIAGHFCGEGKEPEAGEALRMIKTLAPESPQRGEIEKRIANAPEVVRQVLHWLVTKETHTDPWIYYCAALAGNAEQAASCLSKARDLGLSLTPVAP